MTPSGCIDDRKGYSVTTTPVYRLSRTLSSAWPFSILALLPPSVRRKEPSWVKTTDVLGPRLGITAIILTFNEELHILRCLESVKPIADRILVIDSFSDDNTVHIAKVFGAQVFQRRFVNQAEQFQWALDNCNITTDWTLRIDADEYLDSKLKHEIKTKLPTLAEEVSGIYLKRQIKFMGRPIRYGFFYPLLVLRLFRTHRGHMEQRAMDEHLVVHPPVVRTFDGTLTDENLNGLSWYVAKLDNYAGREAACINAATPEPDLAGPAAWRRLLKNHIYYRLPSGLRALMYFAYRFFLGLGFLDGKSGFFFHFFQAACYRILVDAKLHERQFTTPSIRQVSQGGSRPAMLASHFPLLKSSDFNRQPADTIAQTFTHPTDHIQTPLIHRLARGAYRSVRRVLRPRTPVVRQVPVNGLQQLVWANEDIGWRVVATRRFENREINWINSRLREGDVFIDVGGNVGLFSIPAAKAVGPSGRVLTFEPVAHNAHMIELSAIINGLDDIVDVCRQPAGGEAGTPVVLETPLSDGAYTYMRESVETDNASKVLTTTIDAELQARGITKVRAIKIDVEGAEYQVLRGAKQLLGNPQCAPDYVVLELVPHYLKRFGDTIDAITNTLAEAGYAPHQLTKGELEPCDPGISLGRNFFFARSTN